ncbi:MAG: bifunctional phosphopantothenoylcysteine decarboxylase/phosphopantothenate--cysteine ligase CoaBC [Candidatus Accumulibacter sp.]|jgi:phosphopantothenoylcysteine decarboxylase/phosphopantothenate--cysteine ligase|nr:bifunctional phosphopantothenoylcysteine decarboxylase/phosphopantothenate--cysteine ligase CoaBC [Accumulibacter sp.]
MELAEKRIALGVTGGIAAYKSAELVRLFVKQGASARVAMTRAATHFITPTTFQTLSGKRVFTDLWDNTVDNGLTHISFSREADALVVAPASANFIAKVANGIADDLLSTLTLARDCPLLLAPAMNRQMWKNPATRRNIATLRADGVTILGPADGEQACGEIGEGRMIEPEEILEDVVAFFQPKHLAGKKALITAGPTFEMIDPVRGITNLSSGKMGFAIARAARESGAEVTLISGPVNQPTPRGVSRIDVTTALEMRSAVLRQASGQDIFIAVAAVADYRPEAATAHKVKKDASAPPTINLVQNPDILADVVALPDPPFCVGFAAESQNLAEYAEKKRRAKKIPLIVGNLIQDGFGGDENTLVLFDEHGQTPLGPAPKIRLARKIMERIAILLKEKNHATY